MPVTGKDIKLVVSWKFHWRLQPRFTGVTCQFYNV